MSSRPSLRGLGFGTSALVSVAGLDAFLTEVFAGGSAASFAEAARDALVLASLGLLAWAVLAVGRSLASRAVSRWPWRGLTGDALFLLLFFLLLRTSWTFPSWTPRPTWMALLSMAAVSALAAARLESWRPWRPGSRWTRTLALTAPICWLLAIALARLEEPRSLAGARWIGASVLLAVALVVLVGLVPPVADRSTRSSRASSLLPWVAAVLLFSGGLWSLREAKVRIPEDPGRRHAVRHVVLVTVDTLRADALSAMGGRRIATPALDRLASESMLFERAYSVAPWTRSSIASVFTGLPPAVHEVHDVASRLPDAMSTLAEELAAAGYLTAAIGFNPVLAGQANIAQGFQVDRLFPSPVEAGGIGRWLRLAGRGEAPGPRRSTPTLTRMAIDFIDANADRDFFLWLHYFDPHLPYSPPREWLSEEPAFSEFDRLGAIRNGGWNPSEPEKTTIRDLYDGEVRYVDHHVGRVLDALRAKDLFDDALVVFTSDHGEELWDHQGFEHGHTLYHELLHVPLMFKLPHGASQGRIGDRVSLLSLRQTILEELGVAFEQDALGIRRLAPSLRPHWDPRSVPRAAPFLVASNRIGEPRIALTFGDWKVVRWRTNGIEEIYDLASDPAEKNPRAGDAQVAARAEEVLREYESLCREARRAFGIEAAGAPLPEGETRRLLESLGYL